MSHPDLIAVDIGNSRMKLGRFARIAEHWPRLSEGELPLPDATFDLAIDHGTGEFDVGRLTEWYVAHAGAASECRIASVHRCAADRLEACVRERVRQESGEHAVRRLSYRDVPLSIRVDEPARVGIDRLLAAVAVDRLRRPRRAAIVVDLGTAITVDLVDAEGAFCGGAILPGIAMSARALAEHTDALPHVAMDELEAPPAALGKSTVPAIESGLYWGAVGAVRELVGKMSCEMSALPDVFLTGGASANVAEILAANAAYEVHHVPHLVLSGIALVRR